MGVQNLLALVIFVVCVGSGAAFVANIFAMSIGARQLKERLRRERKQAERLQRRLVLESARHSQNEKGR